MDDLALQPANDGAEEDDVIDEDPTQVEDKTEETNDTAHSSGGDDSTGGDVTTEGAKNEGDEVHPVKKSWKPRTLFQPDDLYSLDYENPEYNWEESDGVQRQDDVVDGEEAAMQKELVEFYIQLIQYIASAPEGELKSDDAEDMLQFIRTVPWQDHNAIFELGGIAAIYNIMDRAEGFVDLQVLSCHTLRYLASSPYGENVTLDNGIIQQLVNTVTLHPDAADLQAIVLCSLAELSCSEKGQSKMLESGAHKMVLKALKATGVNDINQKRWSCTTLAFVADDNEEGQAALVESDTLSALLNLLQPEKDKQPDDGVCMVAMLALDRLLRFPAARLQLFQGKGKASSTYLKTLLHCVETHPDNQTIQEHGSQVILSLCMGSSREKRPNELLTLRKANVEEVLQQSIKKFSSDYNICSTAENALAMLSEGYVRSAYYYGLGAIRDLRVWTSGGTDTRKKTLA